jgi:hypothetical protein
MEPGTASRTPGRRETSLRVPTQVATVHRMPPHPPSPQVVSLIDRIKKLVAEQRRLDERDEDDRRRDSNRREIGRLKWRLANAVKRELSTGPGLRPALAFRP